MTVGELSRLLATLPADMRIVTLGLDESDIDDVTTAEVIDVVFFDKRPIRDVGRHSVHRPEMDIPSDGMPAQAFLINW